MKSIKKAIEQKKGKVTIRGWVYRKRKLSNQVFLVIRDATNIIQCTIEKDSKLYDVANSLYSESSVKIEGELQAEERAPTGYEIKVTNLEIVHQGKPFPIAKDFSTEFLLDNRHLWLRSRKMASMLKIRSTVFGAIHEYFRSRGFYEYQSPIFQSVQCEGGSTLFNVPYYKKKGVFLAQTWQLYAEPAIFALEKIYTIAPSFRAENSKTSRHLTEYWHAEMETSWETFEDLQDYAEELMKHVAKKVLKENKEELAIIKRDTKTLEATAKKKFPRMTYDEALKILKEKCDLEIEWGKDLRTVEEDKLSRLYDTPIIVTHYPKGVKAFYMKEAPENDKVVLGFDMIGPEGYGELIGASQREEDEKKIIERLEQEGEDPKQYEFYLDTRRYGSVEHGGFGMGVERILTWICGFDNIKDVIPFPRTPDRYKP